MVKWLETDLLGYSQYVKFDRVEKDGSCYSFFLDDVIVCNVLTMFRLKFTCKHDGHLYFSFQSEIE